MIPVMDARPTITEFMATLKPALTRRGPGSANDVTLAKTIRVELAQAVKAGLLPEDTKCSVRIRHHSSIDVEIVEWHGDAKTGGAIFCDEYTEYLLQRIAEPKAQWNPDLRRSFQRRGIDARLSDALGDTLAAVEAIANRHNYDNSDLMTDYFDVGYYLHVDADPVSEHAERGIKMAHDSAFVDLVTRASAAAATLGPKVIRAVCGPGGVEAAGEYALGRLIRMGAKAGGREMVYDKRRGWVPAVAAA